MAPLRSCTIETSSLHLTARLVRQDIPRKLTRLVLAKQPASTPEVGDADRAAHPGQVVPAGPPSVAIAAGPRFGGTSFHAGRGRS